MHPELEFGEFEVTQVGPARATWAVAAHSGDLRLRVDGTLEAVGWWVDHRPVSSGHEDVLATTWVGTGRAAVALASWAPEPVAVRPEIDWDRLGLEPGKLTAPAIDGFQEGRTFGPDDEIVVAPGKGWLLELR